MVETSTRQPESIDLNDPKSIAHALHRDAAGMCHRDTAADAARVMLGEVSMAKQNPTGAKGVVAALTSEQAAVVNRNDGTVNVKAGEGCRRVNVDFANETVNGMNKEAWDARAMEQFHAHSLTEDAQNVSQRGRAVWAQQMLRDLSSMQTDGTSLDNVAKELLRNKEFSVTRGADNSISSITYTPKDHSGSPVTVNVAEQTVNDKTMDQWSDVKRQQDFASRIAKDELLASKGDPATARRVLGELTSLKDDDYGKGVLKDLEQAHHATLKRADGQPDGKVTEVDFPQAYKAAAVAVNLEQQTLNGKTSGQLRADEVAQALTPFNQRLDKTQNVTLSSDEMTLIREAGVRLTDATVALDADVRDAAKQLGVAILGNRQEDAYRTVRKFIDQPEKAVELAEAMKLLPTPSDNKSWIPMPSPQPILSYGFQTHPDKAGYVAPPRGAYFELTSSGDRIFVGHTHAKIMVQRPNYYGEHGPHYATAKGSTPALVVSAFGRISQSQLEPGQSRTRIYSSFDR